MIAQKLADNYIAIGQNATIRTDAIEVIYELRVAEFYRLVKSTNNWVDRLADKRDIMFAHYANSDAKICKEFDRIFARRKLFVENQEKRANSEQVVESVNTPVTAPKREKIYYKSKMLGTSKLVRIPSKQLIKIVRRKGKNDCTNKPDVVCISNECRERFFSDVKKTEHYKNTKAFEMLYSIEDKETYERWSAHIDKIYNTGLEELTNGNT